MLHFECHPHTRHRPHSLGHPGRKRQRHHTRHYGDHYPIRTAPRAGSSSSKLNAPTQALSETYLQRFDHKLIPPTPHSQTTSNNHPYPAPPWRGYATSGSPGHFPILPPLPAPHPAVGRHPRPKAIPTRVGVGARSFEERPSTCQPLQHQPSTTTSSSSVAAPAATSAPSVPHNSA